MKEYKVKLRCYNRFLGDTFTTHRNVIIQAGNAKEAVAEAEKEANEFCFGDKYYTFEDITLL